MILPDPAINNADPSHRKAIYALLVTQSMERSVTLALDVGLSREDLVTMIGEVYDSFRDVYQDLVQTFKEEAPIVPTAGLIR